MLGIWEYFWTEADWVAGPAGPTPSWVSALVRDSLRTACIFTLTFALVFPPVVSACFYSPAGGFILEDVNG